MENEYRLIGYPLSHSISPIIHKRLFELSGNLDARYSLIEIEPSQMKENFQNLFNLSGFNVTIPYKEFVYEHLKELDESAKRYGSVNVVHKNADGICKGYNTDVYGFLKAIYSMGASLKSNVLLLGCGGVGRMMAIETAIKGGNLTIAVRQSSNEKALKLKQEIENSYKDIRVEIVDINNIPKKKYDLLINSTPSGMYPNIYDIPIDPTICAYTTYLFDAIYNPKETVLMKAAKIYGAKVLGGMSMLIWQAVAAHEIWDNVVYQNKDIYMLIQDMYNDMV